MSKWKCIDNPEGKTFQGQIYQVILCDGDGDHSYQVWKDIDTTVGICIFCEHVWVLPTPLYQSLVQSMED